MKSFICLFFFACTVHFNLNAQVCSANTRGDRQFCVGEQVKLDGEGSPLYRYPLEAEWNLVSSTPSVSVVFDDNTILKPNVNLPNGDNLPLGIYEFELCVICVDNNRTCNTVTYTVGEITHAPTIAAHDTEVCGSELVLQGSTPDQGVTGTWASVSQFDGELLQVGNDLMLDHNGFGECTYTMIYTYEIGDCFKSTSTQVTFTKNYSTVEAQVVDPNSCPSCSRTIQICGTDVGCGGSPEWTITGTPAGVNPSDIQVSNLNSKCTWLTVPENGNYTFEYTIDNGICQSSTAQVSCEINERENFGLSQFEQSNYCLDTWTLSSIFLDEPFFSGATYQWSVALNSDPNNVVTIDDPTSNETTINFPGAPFNIGPDGWQFTIKVTMSFGQCSDVKYYTYLINPKIKIRDETKTFLCGGDPSFKLNQNYSIKNGFGTVTATVTSSSSPALIVGSSVPVNSPLNLVQEGTYCFELSLISNINNPGSGETVTCTDSGTFCVIVADVPLINCGSPIETCLLTTQLNGNTPTDSNGNPINIPVNWTQIGGPTANIINPNSPDPVIDGLSYGETYTFQYTISDEPNCLVQCTNTVTILPESECESCELNADVSECEEGCYYVSLSGADTYMWQPSTNVDDSDPNNPIICNISGGIFQVFGFVNGTICSSAIIELDACGNTSVPSCEFTLDAVCTTCGCGAPIGGARIYDANGNNLNIVDNDITVDWYVDGDYFESNRNPFYRTYSSPYVLCTEISYTLQDGEVCDTTMCVEVVCNGDCPTVNFATCDDLPFSEYSECEEFRSGDNCSWGSFNGYVWAIDAAGNPITDFFLDWGDDAITGNNPVFINGSQQDLCGDIELRVFRAGEESCETTATFATDCCTSAPPQISCARRIDRDWSIFIDQVCVKDVLVTITCLDYDYNSITLPISAENIENGILVVPNIWGCNNLVVSVQAACSDGVVSEPSNCLFLDYDLNDCYEFEEDCEFYTGEEEGDERSNRVANKIELENSNIFPNPGSSENVSINISSAKYKSSPFITYEIIDIKGQLIYKEEVPNSIGNVLIRRQLETGLYFVNIKDKSDLVIESMKMIITN